MRTVVDEVMESLEALPDGVYKGELRILVEAGTVTMEDLQVIKARQEDKTKPEVCVATSVCPRPDRWHCYDEQATEVEVLDFLYALVVMLKPDVVLETGCYYGY